MMKQVLLMATLFLALATANAQPGALDLTFNPTDVGFGRGEGFTSTAQPSAIVEQPDHKYIVGTKFGIDYNGTANKGLVRLNADGTMDGTFNTDPFANGSSLNILSVALQADGKIIIGGGATGTPSNGMPGLARLNPDGSLDAAFNANIGTGVVGNSGFGTGSVYGITLDEVNQKIYVIGNFTEWQGVAMRSIVKLNWDGTVDASFSNGYDLNAGFFIEKALLLPDGNLLIARDAGSFSWAGVSVGNGIIKIDPNGNVIPLFKFQFNTQFRNWSGAFNDMIMLPSGNVLVAATVIADTVISGVKGSANIGEIDPTTGALLQGPGYFTPPVNNIIQYGFGGGSCYGCDAPRKLVLYNNYIIAMGGFTFYNGNSIRGFAKLSLTGVLDPSFNPTSLYVDVFGSPSVNDANVWGNRVRGAVATQNNKLIAVGEFYNAESMNMTHNVGNGIIRLNTNDGTRDETFNTENAITNTKSNSPSQNANAHKLLKSGSGFFIGGAFNRYFGEKRNCIAKIDLNGVLDNTIFKPDTAFPWTNTYPEVKAIGVQSSGKVIAAGYFNRYRSFISSAIVCINPNGTTDPSFNIGMTASIFSYYFSEILDIKVASNDAIYVAGTFGGTGLVLPDPDGSNSRGIVKLDPNGNPVSAFTANTGTGVSGSGGVDKLWLDEAHDHLYLIGAFSSFNGNNCPGICRLNATTGEYDPTFDASSFKTGSYNNIVSDIYVNADGSMYIVGTKGFAQSPQNLYFMAKLLENGQVDIVNSATGSGFNGVVNRLTVDANGYILAGGEFTTYNNISAPYFVRLNPNGVIDANYNMGSGFNYPVRDIVVEGNDYYVAGEFTSYNGTGRNRLAKIKGGCTFASNSGAISYSGLLCSGVPKTFQVVAGANASQYAWTLPPGWTGQAITATNSNIITPNGTGGTITVQASNACGNSPGTSTLVVAPTVTPSAQTITGPDPYCSNSTAIYTVTNTPGYTYTWNLPSGWSGSSTTNSISYTTFSAVTARTITVSATNGGCQGVSSSITVQGTFGTLSTPSVISGPNPVCNGNDYTYAVTNAGAGVTYNWTFPSGWVSTGNTNSVTATAFGQGSLGTITVTAQNGCSTSPPRTLTSVRTWSVPPDPIISGNTSPCVNGTSTYSVSSFFGATYNWELPIGWTGSSTTNSIAATNNGSSGDVKIFLNNFLCGSSGAVSKTVTPVSAPVTPNPILGATSVCNGSNITYSIDPVPDATYYVWTRPTTAGWSGTNPSGTSATYTAGAAGGNITVAAGNSSCGASTPQTLAVTIATAPATPGTISGSTSLCNGATTTYSIAPVAGATSYQWLLPSGWSGASTAESITVTPGATGGTVSVRALNSCGNSTYRNLTGIVVSNTPPTPSLINYATPVCPSTNLFLSTTSVGATSFTWSLPSDWSGSSTTSSIIANTGTTGTVTATASNGCGTSSPRTALITVDPLVPSPTVTIAGSSSSACPGQNVNFSILSSSNLGTSPSYYWYVNGVSLGFGSSFSSNTLNAGDEIYLQVYANDGCQSPAFAISNFITIAPTSCPAGALNFDGIDDEVQFSNPMTSISGSTFTLEFWAKRDAIGRDETILSIGDATVSGNNSLKVGFTSTDDFMVDFGAEQFIYPAAWSTAMSDLGWHHYAIEYYNFAPDLVQLYIDGNFVHNQNLISSFNTAGVDNIAIGNALSGGSYFAGQIDELRVWSGSRSFSITDNFNCEFSDLEPFLLHYYKFNQGEINGVNTFETTLIDENIFSANNGTLLNFDLNGTAISNWVAGQVNGRCSDIEITIPATSFCENETFNVDYNAFGFIPDPGYSYEVELSDEFGSFSAPAYAVIGSTAASSLTGTISTTIPLGLTLGTNYRIRIVYTGFPSIQGSNNGNNVEIKSAGFCSQAIATSTTFTSGCAGTSIQVDFSATGLTPNAGNSYIVELSNASGSFASPTEIGNSNSNTTTSGTISALIPSGIATGLGYRVRVNSTNPALIGLDNGSNLSIQGTLVPSVSLGSSPTGAFCTGTNVTFTATPANGGTSPSYDFKVDGLSVQNGANNTYSSSSLTNGQTVTVELTSNAACASPATVISSTYTASVNTTIDPTVSLAALPAGAFCAGTNITFTATPTNGGTSPSYDFKVDGLSVQNGASNTYSSSALTNGQTVTVELTSNAACASPATVSSSIYTASVNTTLTPTVSLAAIPAGAFCAGTNVTFTATPTNGGTSPSYDFKVDGLSVQNGASNTYSSSALTNGQTVTVELTSNDACSSPATIQSNNITCTVNALPVAYNLSGGGTLCPGASSININLDGSQTGVNYQLFNGISPVGSPIAGTGNPISFEVTIAGNFSVSATSTALCTSNMNGVIAVTIDQIPTQFLLTGNIPICVNDFSEITLSGSEIGFSYQLYFNGNPVGSSEIGTGSTISFGLYQSAGLYSVEMMNISSSCQTSLVSTFNLIFSNPPITDLVITDVSATCGNNNGSIEITGVTGGQPTYSYEINSGGLSASTLYTGLTAGNYIVSVIDINGCSYSETITINSITGPTATTIALNNATCGNNNGSINITGVIGGTAGYAYSLDGSTYVGTALFSGLSTGAYTLFVKDANNCVFSQGFSINSVGGPTVLATTITNESCYNGLGSVLINNVTNGSSPYSYNFNGLGFSANTNYTGLTTGSYTIIVEDANMCTFSTSVFVGNNAGPTDFEVSVVDANCTSGQGSITITSVTGGAPSYTYSIDGTNYNSSNIFFNLNAGSYTVFVKDANNCVYSESVNVIVTNLCNLSINNLVVAPVSGSDNCTLANVSFTPVGVMCTNGIIQLMQNGSSIGTSILWNQNTAPNISFSNLSPGVYTIFVATNLPDYCSTSQDFEVFPTPCSLNIATLTSTPSNGSNGAINVTGAGNYCGVVSYTLDAEISAGNYNNITTNTGNITTQFTGLAPGNYRVTISSAGSTCQEVEYITVTPACNTNPIISATSTTVCPGLPVTLNSNYLTGNVWSNGGNSFNTQVTTAGTYTLTVTEPNGCSGSATITITNATICVPATQMNNGVCGTLNYVRTSAITCIAVIGATQYEWQFSNGSGVYATKTTTTNFVLLHTVTPTLNWGTSWNIKVRAKIGSNVGPYSPNCNIGIMPDPSINGVPQTQLRTQDCNRLNYRINANNRIIANPIAGSIQYEFEFSSAITGLVVATKLMTNNVLFLNTVTPTLTFPAQYNVRVRARIGGTWGVFGTPCLIGIIGLNREEENSIESSEIITSEINADTYFEMMVMPNPFNEQATLMIKSDVNEKVNVEVFDMVGNVVWKNNVPSNTNLSFGIELAQGTYIVKAINQKGNQAMFRFIKSK